MLDAYDDAMRKKRHDDLAEAVKASGINGAATGALYGGVGKLLAGGRTPGSLLKAAGLGAAAYGPLAAGTTALGSSVLGDVSDEDASGYTTRGLVGGLLGGGLLGAGAGALLGSGRLRGLANLPVAGKLAAVAGKELPLDNLLIDKLKHWAANPSGASSAKSAALLGSILGIGAGGVGASEGMQLDYLRNANRQPDDEDQYVR